MVIVSFPIIIRLIDVVTNLIPKTFLKDFLALLHKLHIIALWHYFIVGLLLIVGVYIIKTLQKQDSDKEKARQKCVPIKVINGHCHTCVKKLPSLTAPFCPYCGVEQMKVCQACNEMTYVVGGFCYRCGDISR